MLEINDGYNNLKIDIKNYISEKIRKIKKIDEEDCWCNLYLYIENEYLKLENYHYGLECVEVDMLYKVVEEFLNDKLKDNYIFEPLEPSFKMYFYPYGEEYKDNKYIQENISSSDKKVKLFIAFIEKDTKAPSSDGIIIDIELEKIRKIFKYLQEIINK